jgi:hypothetical protein
MAAGHRCRVRRGTHRRGHSLSLESGGLSITSTIQDVEAAKHIVWSGTAIGARAFHAWTLIPRDRVTLVSTEESMEGWLVALLKTPEPGFLRKSQMCGDIHCRSEWSFRKALAARNRTPGATVRVGRTLDPVNA